MRKIYYLTQPMNRASGASKSGYDVLRALSDVQSVQVLSNRNISLKKLPKLTNPAKWKFVRYSAQSGLGLRSIYRRLMNLFSTETYILNGNEKDLLIVNSFCIYLVDKINLNEFLGTKVCVVRGSVSSFESIDSTISVEKAVEYLSKFDSLIYVSAKTQDEWQEYKGISNKVSYYIPNCCDEESIDLIPLKDDLFKKYSAKLDLNGKYIISCIGSVQYRKGQDILIDAIINIGLTHPEIVSKIHVFIVGGDVGGFSATLMHKIEVNGLQDTFTFTGYTSDALEYLKISNVMVLPSRGEAMPRSILESMLMKIPVISTNLDGIPELIDDDIGGILTTPGSVEELSKAIIFSIGNEFKMAKMSDYSYKKYWESFSRQAQFQRYRNLIKNDFI